MKTFTDLSFDHHPITKGRVATIHLGDVELSVVSGKHTYSMDDSFEVMFIHNGVEHVFGWLEPNDITQMMMGIQIAQGESK